MGLTSIDFLPLGAGTFPRSAFLSFATVLFLVRFLLVHSGRLELLLRRGESVRPGSRPQDAHRERFGLVLQSKQDQSSAYHTTQATSGKLPHRSSAPLSGDMPLRQRCARLMVQ